MWRRWKITSPFKGSVNKQQSLSSSTRQVRVRCRLKMRPIYPLLQAVGSQRVPKTCRVQMAQLWKASMADWWTVIPVTSPSRHGRQQHFCKGGAHGPTVGARYDLKCKRHLSAEAPGAAGGPAGGLQTLASRHYRPPASPACTPLCGHQFHPPPPTKQHVCFPAYPTRYPV